MVEKCQEKYALKKMLSVSRGLFFSRTKALNSKSYKIKNAGQKMFPEKQSHGDFSSTRWNHKLSVNLFWGPLKKNLKPGFACDLW